MKIILSVLFILSNLQYNNKNLGKYEYKANHYWECIVLKENNIFEFQSKGHMSGLEKVNGRFIINGDSLILNSVPQREKIIVKEKYLRKNRNNYSFSITDRSDFFVQNNLNLNLSFDDGTIESIQIPFGKFNVKTKKKIKSFYVGNIGLKFPNYNLKSDVTNTFDVKLEFKRIFDSEIWLFEEDKIKPMGVDREYQKYFLVKSTK